uniref:Protein bassoon n=1 Tax=Geotrypetes seraphini TaxID=260995 RepID=A0A6P8PF03_GEOSA|nr:protein bassoon [Geotrypetes seraphini]
MGNETSLEGAGQAPENAALVSPQPGTAGQTPSAPSGGQLPGPRRGSGGGSVSGKLEHSERLAGHKAAPQSLKQSTQRHEGAQETKIHMSSQQQADNTMKTLQVDNRSQRSRRSPSASPVRGNSPSSPYSVPQIAPLPSSTLCPICNTTDLTSSPNQPNFNTCTQCHNEVCKQCGFNPNPHLTEVKEWLCLNCQMQRALGMDMTTATRSKSQQQLHSPSLSPSHSPAKQSQTQPEPKQSNVLPQPQLQTKVGYEKSLGAMQTNIRQDTNILPSPQAKAQLTSEREQFGQALPKSAVPHPQEVVGSYPQHQQAKPSSLDKRKRASDSPAKSPTQSSIVTEEEMQEGLTGKIFGFGASLLNQASTLISVHPEATPPSHHSPGKVPPKIVFSDASKETSSKHSGTVPGMPSKSGSAPTDKQGISENFTKLKGVQKDRTTCPLCKVEINVGSNDPSNYNTCTVCKKQVCNMCGFNPTPHLVEKNEWLCLNCQTQRLLEGSLGDGQTPMPLPTPKQQTTGSPRHQQSTTGQQQSVPLGISEKNKMQPTKEEKKPSATIYQDKLQSKTPAESPKVAKPVVPKGKSIGTRKDTTAKESKTSAEIRRDQEETNKTYPPDLSRSPQSMSDTGYSSDGISSSQSEITGLVQQEEEQLSGAGQVECSPPSPSELIKLESSVRPLLESKDTSRDQGDRGKIYHELREDQRQRQRPRSLSITPETFDSDEELEDIMEEDEDSLEWENRKGQMDNFESSDDFGSKLRHDYVEDSSEGGFSPLSTKQKRGEFTDEEFMRRQILEMSAEEDNLDDDEEYVNIAYKSVKSSHKPDSEKGKDSSSTKRQLSQNSSSMYDDHRKAIEALEGEEMAQGGLRRFKTIELNSTNNYNRDIELSHEADLSLDREPELEMESLTGSPEEKSRGEYSSTLPATTPSYTSGTSPTSISSLEEDSDSSPSRRQRLEEVKQQRKARHRSHGPLLPTIEDSSEEEELREEEELLREQEKMREVEQQRIRSTARKTKRDKEELRAQRRRERSKTPPSNLSPIEDASPTEELRQAAEMEELHRSSCSEYSPSIDSEAEGFDLIASKLYKSGSEYNLPTFMSLYSPTEKMSTYHSNKPLKSAEEVYEEMMRKAEIFQKQQVQQSLQNVPYGNTYQEVGYGSTESQNNFEYQFIDEYNYDSIHMGSSQTEYQNEIAKSGTVYEEILQTSQNISRMHQSSSLDLSLQQEEKASSQENAYQEKQFLNAGSAYSDMMKQTSGSLTPGTSPTQLAAPVSFLSSESSGGRTIPDVRVTQHFSKEEYDQLKLHSSVVTCTSSPKVIATSYQYSKGCSIGTSMATPHQTITTNASNALIMYSSPSSISDASYISSTNGSYSQPKVTSSYISNKDQFKHKGSAEIRETLGDKFQSGTDSITSTSLASKVISFFKSSSPPLSPTSPTQFVPRKGMSMSSVPGAKSTAEFSTQTQSTRMSCDLLSTSTVSASSSMIAQGTQTPHQFAIPRLSRQQSSQEAPCMVITLASDASSQTKSINVSSSISPITSPTRMNHRQTIHSYSQTTGNTSKTQQEQSSSSYIKKQTIIERTPTSSSVQMHDIKGHISIVDTGASAHSWGALPAENISLCRISSVPGTSRVEPAPKPQSGSAVDLRTALKPAPVIITDQGMDLTSLASETRKYSLTLDQSPTRQSTAVQPLIINLSAQEQPHAIIGTATTVSITIASSMLVTQPKQPIVYGDPFQNRTDLGQGTGSAMHLTQVRQMEQAIQSGILRGNTESTGISNVRKPDDNVSQQTVFARYNLPNQMTSLVKKDMLITQTSRAPNMITISTFPKQDQMVGPSEIHRQFPMELKTQNPLVTLNNQPSHAMMVQLDDIETGTMTKLIKEETSSSVLDLTGIKPESQMACCDMVYKFPFGSSCTGAFIPSSKIPEKNVGDITNVGRSAAQYYGKRDTELSETYPYKESLSSAPNMYEEHKLYPQGPSRRLHSSMSETNLSEIALNYYSAKSEQPFQSASGECAMDLTTMKNSYSFSDGGYLGQGLQYGSFTDLRQPKDLLSHSLPMRRYSSMSNIYSDYRYSARDLKNLQECSLAQYSATTAREISRMCAALNSMDQYGGRHTNNPDLLQYGPSFISVGPTGSSAISAQQGLSSVKTNMMYSPNYVETYHGYGNLVQNNISGPQTGAIHQLYPSTAIVRAADGMIYSTINTPIASTLPITTQPASVLRPMFQAPYRPYSPGNITAVPLTSLTRVPLYAPRIPLTPQVLYRSSTPSRFATVTTASLTEVPMYLGKLINPLTANIVSKGPVISGPVPTPITGQRPEHTNVVAQEDHSMAASGVQSISKEISQLQQESNQKQQIEAHQTLITGKINTEKEEKEKEEERQRKQQEHMLHIEREKVELEKLRQLRLHEELERERIELQRHREKEQILVQREIHELQSIKQQVLQQQQEERQTQFAMQREQLAQQRMQLEQIQQLQQQLQQQLEEQKRQKTTIPPACDSATRMLPQTVSEIPIEMQRTLAQNGQYWPPMNQSFIAMAATGQEMPTHSRCLPPQRPLINSVSEISLQTEHWEGNRSIKKRNSMPRLRDAYEMDEGHDSYIVKKITDSSVQTDDEDGEDKYFISRRRRTRRSTDCSVQTDDEDNADWEQPVRRRRSRFSRHSDSGSDGKHESAKGTSSIAIQTISDCSVQTELDQLQRVSPSIHITTPDPKVEIVKYISAPEKTHYGESLACQTEPETHCQGIVPQFTGSTTVSPFTSNIQITTSGPIDPNNMRQQATTKFDKKKPDPLEIGYQSHLPTESLSQLVACQPPKSPQVLYSPVSPLSPHRLLESTFTSTERFSKARVTPQKYFTVESSQRHQTLPRPIKTIQRSLSDPKPISPTYEELEKDKFSIIQHQFLQGSQPSVLQSSMLTRKVKRTLPSPPSDEGYLPLSSQAHSPMYMSSLTQKTTENQAILASKTGFLKTIDRDLKIVEQESTKLRKKQAELDEEEKEIDAKLKYLELGITQRKESLTKDKVPSRQEFSYLRCLRENRDYMSDSELNNLQTSSYASSSLLTKPSTAPLSQYSEFSATQQFPTTTSSYSSNVYQYPAGQTVSQGTASFPYTRFQSPHYPVSSNGPSQNDFQTHQLSTYSYNVTQGTGYQSELGLQNHASFQPPNQYPIQTTYQSQLPLQPAPNSLFQSQSDTFAAHQKPRQTILPDLEKKISTNYEVLANPSVVISSTAPEAGYSSTVVPSSYDQYKASETRSADRSNAMESPSTSYSSDSLYTNLEQNIPRNYVMIEDISELTKDNASSVETQNVEPQLSQNSNGRHVKEKNELVENDVSNKPCCYSRAEEESEEDIYDHHSSDHRGKSSYHRNLENNGRVSGSSSSSSYYYGDNDYKHSSRSEKHSSSTGMQKHSSKNLAPAVVSSKRSKHRKQVMEQKISKFSPIEEAKDVESDLASYPVTTSVSSSINATSKAKKFQDDITYGLKKNIYEQQKYYGVSSRDIVEEGYSSGSRSRSASNYASDRSNRDVINSRNKSYERENAQKTFSKPSSLNMSHSRGRAPIRSQTSEEKSPVSPMAKTVSISHSAGGSLPQTTSESCPPFCSSHSLPDVQEHVKEVPRNHSYKQEEACIMDDSHCVVSDSEAYHLGQEETDWFDKPREARSERSRYYSGHSSSSQKKTSAKHTYHNYDEPPDEDLWQHDDYSQSRHSSSKEHRHHGESGRHSFSSRHPSDESRRSSKQHPRDQSRYESRPHSQPSSQKKAQQSEIRTQSALSSNSSDYSQQSRQSSNYHQKQTQSAPPFHQHKSESQQQPVMKQQQLGQQQQQQQSSSRQQQNQQQPPRQQQVGSSQQGSHQQQPSHSQVTHSHGSPQQQSSHTQAAPPQGSLQQQPSHPQASHQQGSLQHASQQQPKTQQQQQQGQSSSRPLQQQPIQSQQPEKQQTTQPQGATHQTGLPKSEHMDSPKPAMKAAQGRPPQAHAQGIPTAGIKVGQKPIGTTTSAGAASGHSGQEGESMFSKILPGAAAEQAGKLTDAVSAFGKKFTSLW